jgi:hypothetical protein
MKKLLVMLLWASQTLAQPWSSNGICDFTDGQQWNNGGAKGCACTWYSTDGIDTTLNCAFGDCGQSDLLECAYDCNGHNGNTTDQIPRQCDANADPICWFNGGGGAAGEIFCQGLALPVEFIGMEGFPKGSTNVIKWSTSSEYNVSHFTIGRSIDGRDYELMATILAAGNTTIEQHYRAIDLNPPTGVSYYMLTEYDYDGYIEILGVVAVKNVPLSIVKTTDMMGRDVDPEIYKGVMIVLYDDGSKALFYK